MTTNIFASNELAEKGRHPHHADSPQASERTGVVSSPQAPESATDADFLIALAVNASVSSEMQRARRGTAALNAHNAFRASNLTAAGRTQAALTTREKSARAHRSEIFLRWWRFNLVGAIGIFVQLGALFLLKSVLHFNYLAATTVAVEMAVIHNFVWHEQFTWADRVRFPLTASETQQHLIRFLRFNLTTGGVSIAGNLVLMKVIVGWGHMNYLVANVFAVALCSVANFLVSDNWVFSP